MNTNFILMADSYKFSHWLQYPEGTDGYFGYIEARGCERGWNELEMFSLQIFLKRVLSKPITQENIDEAAAFAAIHGEPFNKEGWEYILKTYNGYIPVTIKALPEGTIAPLLVPIVTVECLDKNCFWVGSFLETALLRAVWYGTTVATLSWQCRQVIKKEMELSCDVIDGLNFKLHDFGARGVSSAESAGIGGAAHLASGAMGSDTIEGIWTANKYYNIAMAGFSIPAAEHSTITSWGKDGEVEAYRNMLQKYAKPGAILAVVSDSYDIFNACENLWGGTLKQEVIDSGAIVVIRPDSGDPETVVLKCIEILGEKFGTTRNSKGYQVLNNVRLIQGDGVNERSIRCILANLRLHGWSAGNIAFGMGGALLQGINRDTLQFAMKCSAIRVNGEWRDVSKNPVTDSGKRSKAGRISTYQKGHGPVQLVCERVDAHVDDPTWEDKKIHMPDAMDVVYELRRTQVDQDGDGIYTPVIKEYTFDEIRARANK
jgi:nicotinamide phosphoribosyltransferase